MEMVKDKIIEILSEDKNNGLEALEISRKIGLTYDMTSRYLKEMTEERLLIREGKKKEGNVAWNYYYTLNDLQ